MHRHGLLLCIRASLHSISPARSSQSEFLQTLPQKHLKSTLYQLPLQDLFNIHNNLLISSLSYFIDMACERRVWRYGDCDHEEELDVRCGLGADPDHVHNTIIVETENPPQCSTCNPPPPIDEDRRRTLDEAAADRHLPAIRTIERRTRGVNAEILTEVQTSSNADDSNNEDSAPVQNGAAVNGTTANGASRHAPHRSLDTVHNVPARGPVLDAVQPPSGSPVLGLEDEESSQRETDSNTEQS